MKQLDRLFYEFIWGKTEKIKRNVMINELDKGGVKMVDTAELFRAVKAAWVPRMLNANDNDTSGTAVQEIMKSHVPSRTLTDPSSWGSLTLQ